MLSRLPLVSLRRKVTGQKYWVLTNYTNHPGGNLVHKNKIRKFHMVGE